MADPPFDELNFSNDESEFAVEEDRLLTSLADLEPSNPTSLFSGDFISFAAETLGLSKEDLNDLDLPELGFVPNLVSFSPGPKDTVPVTLASRNPVSTSQSVAISVESKNNVVPAEQVIFPANTPTIDSLQSVPRLVPIEAVPLRNPDSDPIRCYRITAEPLAKQKEPVATEMVSRKRGHSLASKNITLPLISPAPGPSHTARKRPIILTKTPTIGGKPAEEVYQRAQADIQVDYFL